MGGEIYFVSDTKEVQKSDLQSPPEPHNEEENKATPLRCELENLVEEQATKLFVQKEDKVNNMNDKRSYFCNSHVHLHPYDPWEDGKTSLSSEDYKMKDNCEGDESAPSLPVSEPKINAEEDDTSNNDKVSFVSVATFHTPGSRGRNLQATRCVLGASLKSRLSPCS